MARSIALALVACLAMAAAVQGELLMQVHRATRGAWQGDRGASGSSTRAAAACLAGDLVMLRG